MVYRYLKKKKNLKISEKIKKILGCTGIEIKGMESPVVVENPSIISNLLKDSYRLSRSFS